MTNPLAVALVRRNTSSGFKGMIGEKAVLEPCSSPGPLLVSFPYRLVHLSFVTPNLRSKNHELFLIYWRRSPVCSLRYDTLQDRTPFGSPLTLGSSRALSCIATRCIACPMENRPDRFYTMYVVHSILHRAAQCIQTLAKTVKAAISL
jgi:hypothetical protein